jgi:hypothetical protein
MCRRSTGAPVVAWAAIPTQSFRLTKGALATYKSSEKGTRFFCGTCGAQFYFQDKLEEISLNIATLDDPNAIEPSLHIFDADRIPWLAMNDGLPRFAAGEADGNK